MCDLPPLPWPSSFSPETRAVPLRAAAAVERCRGLREKTRHARPMAAAARVAVAETRADGAAGLLCYARRVLARAAQARQECRVVIEEFRRLWDRTAEARAEWAAWAADWRARGAGEEAAEGGDEAVGA